MLFLFANEMSDERAALLEALLAQRAAHAASLRALVEKNEALQRELDIVNSDIDDVTRDSRVAEGRLLRMKQRLIETKRLGVSPTGGSSQVGQVDVELTPEERDNPLLGMLSDVVSSMVEFDEARSRKR